MKSILIALAAVFAARPPVAAQDDPRGRAAAFRAAVPAARGVATPPASAREFAAAARAAAKIYDDWIPQDLQRAHPATREDSSGVQWYKLGFQETELMGKEARRLLKNCGSFREAPDARPAARTALAAAEKFLSFLNETPWPESFRPGLLTDLPRDHRLALAQWKELAACFPDGGAPASGRGRAAPAAQPASAPAPAASDGPVPLLR